MNTKLHQEKTIKLTIKDMLMLEMAAMILIGDGDREAQGKFGIDKQTFSALWSAANKLDAATSTGDLEPKIERIKAKLKASEE